MIEELHRDHFRVALHAVILSDKLGERFMIPVSFHNSTNRRRAATGTRTAKTSPWVWTAGGRTKATHSTSHRAWLATECIGKDRKIDRPNERPYALHRNGYAGMQRYASFLWSGDVFSTWETLRAQVPIGINTSLTGIPYWGTDIGGFVPTKEFTAELYLRWFQFGAFCPLFRSHGRAWKLRLPWGWNTGDAGPAEINNYGGAAIPDPSQLHDARVEPTCRKYLELRYRLLPYLYSAVKECCATGLPIMRALWLHYPDDPSAVARGDEYLFGKNLLVAPVVEKGATARQVYLPKSNWYDFWTNERIAGGREISRDVNLETIPLYVRAGSILPLGPLKQYTTEAVDQPLTVLIYSGADCSFLLYEDDGTSFNHRKGEWMGIQMAWNDARHSLALELASGSRMLTPVRNIEIRLREEIRSVRFDGNPVKILF